MQLLLFNIGLISLLGQVILLRELAVASYGVELIYLYALGVWLLCTAIGALFGRRRFASPGVIAAAFLGMALLLPLEVAFIRAGRLLFAGVPGAYLPFYQQLLVPVLALCPFGVLAGFLFPLTAMLYIAEKPATGRTLAGAYGIESLGALAGGALATLSLKFHVPVIATALLGSAFIALNVLMLPGRKLGRVWSRIAVPAAAGALIALFGTTWLDHETGRWHHPHLQETQDTAYGRITVSGMAGQAAVFENDVLSFETEGVEGETFAHLLALQHPRPRRILLLGGGTEGIVAALRQHNPERLVVVEMNARMVGMVLRHLPPARRQDLANPPVRLIFADPRRFLRAGDAYDLILVALPDPASGQTNRFYTREFFQSCAARLRPGGIVGLRLRAAENIWPPPLTQRLASIHRALQSSFPHVLFLPGSTNIISASASPLPEAAAPLIARWQERRLDARLVRPPFISYLFANDRFTEIRKLLAATATAANSDLQPVCYRYTLQLWLAKFFPRAAFPEQSIPGPRLLLGLVPVILVFLGGAVFLVRSVPSGRWLLLAGLAGFCGMMLQNVLLLHYQVKDGALYQDIGVLMASFMAGMALGALLPLSRIPLSARGRGRALLGIFLALVILIQFALLRPSGLGLPLMAVLQALSGFFAGALFAHAARSVPAGGRALISPLYAADLAGGAAGAILGGLILIPAAGLAVPVAIAGVLIFLSLLIV